MSLNSFLKDPRYDSLRSLIVLLIVVVLGIFVIITARPYANRLLGLVNPADSIGINLELSSIPGAGEVQKGIYSVGAAKLYDELSPEDGWLDTTKTLMGELEPNNIRYPTGGLVKYIHAFTAHMSQPLTATELANVVNVGYGPEIRGNGYITQDRIDEETRGNDGELAEITAPKPIYGNLSYIEGFQNTKSRNFIHDYVEIADSANAGTLFVVNMRYASPNEVADQIKFLVDNGQTITGVEMENEAYAKGGFYYIPGNPSVNAPIAVTNYLNDADEYRSAISAKVPGLTYAVVAAPKKGVQETADGFDSDTDFNGYWNTALATQMGSHGYSNYIMHFYAPFSTCKDEIDSGDRDSIFSCGNNEMHTLRKLASNDATETVFPALLDWYANKFPGKHMWLTEWNVNQDPTKTDSKFANSVLHGIFTQNILTMIDDANARHNNFVTFASYHTFATDGGNAMVNRHVSKGAGNSEPSDINGFVRRTPYYAFLSMKEIYKDGYIPMNSTFTLDNAGVDVNDITIDGYKKSDGTISLAITNTSQKTLSISSLKIDGKSVDLENSSASGYFMDGDANYSSRGETEFAINPGHEVSISEEQYNKVSDVFLPGYGVGTLKINTPSFVIVKDNQNQETPSPDNNTSYTGQTITYATISGTPLQFDLSKPDGAMHPLPLVFFLHGGPFGPGGLNAAEGFVDEFTGAGYAVAEVSYRGTNLGLFPSQLQDLKGAVRYARAHSAELNIDPNKIAVLGSSSGGMLMSLVGTSGGVANLEGTTGGNTSFSSTPNAVVNLFGSVDPANIDNLSDTVLVTFKSLFGCSSADTCPQRSQAVSANYVDGNDPAFLIIHGTDDASVPYENSIALNEILKEAGVDTTFITAPGIGHDKDAILTNYMKDIVNFLDSKLYGTTTDTPTNNETGACSFWKKLLGQCGGDSATNDQTVTDSKDPTVVISSPIDNSILGTNVVINAKAKDDTAVTKVDFYAEPIGLLGSDTEAPYTYLWNTSTAPSGTYHIQAKAYDAAGNVGSSTSIRVKKN